MAATAILNFESVNISGLNENMSIKCGGQMHHGHGDDRRYSENIRIININNRDVKRGQMLEAEVEAKARTSRPRSRPRPNT